MPETRNGKVGIGVVYKSLFVVTKWFYVLSMVVVHKSIHATIYHRTSSYRITHIFTHISAYKTPEI